MELAIKIKHNNNKIRIIHSKKAHLHVEIIEKLLLRFNSIYKDKLLEPDYLYNHIVDTGYYYNHKYISKMEV